MSKKICGCGDCQEALNLANKFLTELVKGKKCHVFRVAVASSVMVLQGESMLHEARATIPEASEEQRMAGVEKALQYLGDASSVAMEGEENLIEQHGALLHEFWVKVQSGEVQ